jgi:hypothetical protein
MYLLFFEVIRLIMKMLLQQKREKEENKFFFQKKKKMTRLVSIQCTGHLSSEHTLLAFTLIAIMRSGNRYETIDFYVRSTLWKT